MSDLSNAMSGPPFSREEITQDEVRKHDRRLQAIERRLQMSGANVSNSYTIIGMTPPSLAMDYTFTASGGTVTITPNGSDNAFTYSVDLGVFVPGVLPSDTPLTLDYSGFTTDANYSVFLGAATPLYELSAVAWTNVTTPGPAALAIQNGVPVLASDKNLRYMGMFYFPTSGDPVITIPGGDVNWGGPVDGATVGGLMYAVDITGKVILCSSNLVWDNAGQVLSIGGEVRGLSDLYFYAANAAAASDDDGKEIIVAGGKGDGTGEGGTFLAIGGDPGENGDGGSGLVYGADGGSISGKGGDASLGGGSAQGDGDGGSCNIIPGQGAGAGVDGVARIGDLAVNCTQFDRTGHQTMIGDARPWRDELSDAVSLQQSGPGISRNVTEVTVDYTTSANLSDFMYANIQLNHDKDLSVSIYPHIHWFQAEDNIPNFLLAYRWQTNGAAKVTSWTYLPCNTPVAAYVSGTITQICYSAAIDPPAGSDLSDIVQFKIYRDNDNDSSEFVDVDPYTATVGVLAFDVHFQINSLGSTEELVK